MIEMERGFSFLSFLAPVAVIVGALVAAMVTGSR
jgi:hypothetical protein